MAQTEPISVFPKAPPKVSPLYYYTCSALFFIFTYWCLIGIVSIQLPSLLVLYAAYPILPFVGKETRFWLKGWCYMRYKSLMNLTEMVYASYLLALVYLFSPATIVFTGAFQQVEPTAQSIVISNHQIYPDCIF